MRRLPAADGFTLLEVLIAVLIFTFGLMGIAALLTMSVKTNHSAYLRTQATFMAQAMADRMRANPLALWKGGYAKNTITTPPAAPAAATFTSTTTMCTSASPCDYAGTAARDLATFQNQLLTFLPNPGVAISCVTPGSIPTSDQLLTLPPYAQTCEIEISWTQLPINGQTAAQAAAPDIFDWVFQP